MNTRLDIIQYNLQQVSHQLAWFQQKAIFDQLRLEIVNAAEILRELPEPCEHVMHL